MKVSIVNSTISKGRNIVLNQSLRNTMSTSASCLNQPVSFKGRTNITKQAWLKLRNLSDYMKEASEMTNAVIAMIGTGIIAPFAIMWSPKKKCQHAQDEKVNKDKKFFQAIRQPVSAFLAFAFQVPTTVGIMKGLNHLAYKKHAKLFDDEVLGHLIPSKKYLKNEAANVLKPGANPELVAAWKQELELANNTGLMQKEFKNQVKQNYQEVGIKVGDAELDKMAADKKKMTKFLTEKMAAAKHDRLLNEKVQELSGKHFDIKDVDLVTEDYQNLAKLKYKKDLAKLKKKAKLTWFDKFIQSMGFSNKKLNELGKAEKTLAQEKGLELMRKDMPEVFTDKLAKLRKFVENKNIKAQKLYANKIFWLTLGTNLFMVGFSCVALNWLHPKFANLIDRIKGTPKQDNNSSQTKVEVKQ